MVTLVTTSLTGDVVVGGGVNTLAFEDPVDDTAAVAMLGWVDDFWATCATSFTDNVTYQVNSNPQRYAAANGQLQGIFDAAAPAGGVGSASTDPVARATQVLIRWNTADIVDGRVVKGRSYIPGMPSASITAEGQLESVHIAVFDGAIADLISDSGGTLSVWHRPKYDNSDPPVLAGGSSHLVTSGSCATDFAVLRSRRD